MPIILNVMVEDKGFEQEFYEKNIFKYSLDDGTEIGVPHMLAWCTACGKAVSAEQLPELYKIENRLNDIKEGKLDKFLNLDNSKRSKEIEYHERVYKWRESRGSSRKCLECGSNEVFELNEPEGYPPQYPPGITIITTENEQFKVEVFLGGHINLKEMSEIKYDPEGDKV